MLACPLDWHERVPGLGTAIDVVVGSDVCYDPAAVPLLVQLLQQLLAPGGASVAYIATTKRHPTTLQLFLDLAAAAGLQVSEQWPVESGGRGGVQLPPAVFQQLPALTEGEGRERFVLHRVVAADGGA